MSFTDDEEILQDFLVEAGEIIEQLGEQLVDLESRPQDAELLNAVFRGYHTIKGGAGFLGIDALVAVCHRAEDVFNILRQGDRLVDAELMDVVLNAHDVVTSMIDSVAQGDEPEPADQELLDRLTALAVPASGPGDSSGSAESTVESAPSLEDGEGVSPGDSEASSSEDTIDEDEFEALLDQLHGGGAPGGASGAEPVAEPSSDEVAGSSQSPSSDEITDEEFEALLDQLHGKAAPGATASSETPPPDEGAPPAPGDDGARPLKTSGGASDGMKKDARQQKKPAATQGETTVRVDTSRLDDIMNLVGELVLVRNRLTTLESVHIDESISMAVDNLDLVTSDLQLAVMKTRMQPIKKVFGRFPRVVRDLARNMNKEITLKLIGEETDLDKNLVEALADPLVHLVRNAVDHGIETPDVREMTGKPRNGTVVLSAQQEGDHILLTIADDGAGMDADKIRRSAVEKGMMDTEAANRLSDQECYQLIFMAGFSTKTEISDVSGRGVGMDVVKTKINQLNGSLDVESELGKGSKIIIKVPLTLAIMPTLMIKVSNQVFALPLGSISEIFHFDQADTKYIDGKEVILIRDVALPLYHLRKWLVRPGFAQDEAPEEGHVVVVNVGGRQVGFVVDKLLGQEEVVIKPLGALLNGTRGMAGATITGDGRISLILDVPGLLTSYACGM